MCVCVCIMFLTCTMQITDAQDADDLRAVFAMDEAAELLLSTGFRKLICSLAMEDKECLRSVLLDYHCLLKVKAEMDQFAEGLKSLGVLNMMKRHPDLISSLFVDGGSTPLTPGRIYTIISMKEFVSVCLVSCTYTGSDSTLWSK